jgi:hypothetical protein
LAAGVEVGDDWSDAALAHFGDPQIWAVSPATYCSGDHQKLLGSGIDETMEGIVAPPWWAGFYRKDLLEGAIGGFDTTLGDRTAVADLAWRQAIAGRSSITEPREVVFAPASWLVADYGMRAGYETERLFWRRRAGRNHRPSLFGHLLLLAFLATSGVLHPQRWLYLAAKLFAWPAIGRFRRDGKQAVESALADRTTATPERRVKAPHMIKSQRSNKRSGRNPRTSA